MRKTCTNLAMSFEHMYHCDLGPQRKKEMAFSLISISSFFISSHLLLLGAISFWFSKILKVSLH